MFRMKQRISIALLVTTIVAFPFVAAADFVYPDTPAGSAAKEWFDAAGSGDKNELRRFFEKWYADDETYSSDEDVMRYSAVLRDTGALSPHSIIRSEEFEIVLLAEGTKNKWLRVIVGVESTAPHNITKLGLRKSSGPDSETAAVKKVSSATQREIALAAAKLLRDGYVYEELGEKYADMLVQHVEKPSEPVAAEAFATTLTRNLQSIQPDKHLQILDPARAGRVFEMYGDAGDHHAGPSQEDGFGRVEWFEDSIVYVELTRFSSGESAIAKAAEIMSSAQDAKAIVFDLRNNPGGDGEIVEMLEAYLFAEPTHVMSSIRRGAEGEDRELVESWTTTNELSEKMSSLPVFVFINSTTGSAAEAFSFGLQGVGRAIIIGQRSSGAGHRVMYERLPHGFGLGLPVGAAINPKTGKGWEGVGVIPDMETEVGATLEELLGVVRARVRQDQD